ncbi:hypothetical protein [Sphingobacterium yanglingense]|uniref:Cold shock CspA family protein n=1 Tax=Sphingobacterium yanglingense TaxID=1437280 RepID=A0A4R6WPA3_9SPHI|nr:hypothetical protein [Sphingobacterium yanglingense]TDQ80235.1 hypothetical protein CLV99_1692 [Sphingobacterium yanglingense]
MARETKRGLYQGIVERDEKGNYYCGPYLLDYKLTESSFKLGDKVSIKKIVSNTSGKSVEEYPQKAIKFSLAGEDRNL